MKLLIVLITLYIPSVYAILQVYPTRVILNDRVKTTTITLRNKEASAREYVLKTVFFQMDSLGNMIETDKTKPEDRSAHELIRFSPRKIILEPGQEQVVRIMLKPNPNLENADYRIHLKFQPEPKTNNLVEKLKTVEMSLDAQVAVAIGIIYRKGELKNEVKLSDFSIFHEKEKSFFNLKMENLTNTFPIGSFKLFFKPFKQDKEFQIAIIHGISSYVKDRIFKMPIENPEKINLKDGTVRLEFLKPEEENSELIQKIEINI